MNDPQPPAKRHDENEGDQAINSDDCIRCPVLIRRENVNQLTMDFAEEPRVEADCLMAPVLHSRRRFEAVLTELSATFVNVSANQVDAQIESALRELAELLGMDRIGLGQVLADGSKFVVTHSHQLPGVPPSAKIIITSQFPTYAKMIRQARVIRVPDDLPEEATLEREYCQQTGLKSNLTIPLTVMGTVVGGIGFTSYHSRRVLPDELIPRLRLVGDIFTNALARKRADEKLQAHEQSLRQTRQRLEHLAGQLLDAQEQERRRIAREMHDDWAQRLAVLGMQTAKLNGHLVASDQAEALLSDIREQLVILSEDVHDLSRQLHPSILDDLGLAEALRSECGGISKRHGITIDYRTDGVPANIPTSIALGIYRVAQEGLRNIAKHAGVSRAVVSLKMVGPQLQLLVRDQGSGFDMESERHHARLGLSSMEERVRLIGGELSIKSAPGQGATVEVRVLLPESKL